MSTKSAHDIDTAAHDSHSKHHQGDHDKRHHKDQSTHSTKHPPLREAMMKAAKSDAGSTQAGHAPIHGRPRAGTLTRRDTGHGLPQGKHHSGKGHEHDRQSVGKQSEGHAASVVEYENTYRLEPGCSFPETKVREIIANVFNENLVEKEYDPQLMSRRCLELSDIIKERVKQLDMKRFKIICMVIIGQIVDQSMMISSRCLWNFKYDNFSSFTLKRSTYYAIGMVFATYVE